MLSGFWTDCATTALFLHSAFSVVRTRLLYIKSFIGRQYKPPAILHIRFPGTRVILVLANKFIMAHVSPLWFFFFFFFFFFGCPGAIAGMNQAEYLKLEPTDMTTLTLPMSFGERDTHPPSMRSKSPRGYTFDASHRLYRATRNSNFIAKSKHNDHMAI